MHAMRKLIILLSALVYVIHAQAQFSVTAHQEGWDNIPPQVQKPINAKIRSESLTERISWKTGRTQRIEHITRICNI